MFSNVTKLLLPLTALLLLAGCHDNRQAEGPAERAGKHMDDAAHKTGTALEKAARKTDEVAHKAVQATGDAFEKAGRKLKGSPSATPAPSSGASKP